MLADFLTARGHTVTACENGCLALDAAAQESFPLVLVDWQMPLLNGPEFCRRLRALPHGNRSVVLMITGRIGANSVHEGLAAGADDFLTKPLDAELLKLRLAIAERHALNLLETGRVESALREAEEKYRSIFENATEGIYQSTPNGQFLNANPELARIYGYASPAELLASVTDIAQQIYVDPQSRALFQQLMAEHGEVRGLEYQIRRKGGSIIWVSEHSRAVRASDGAVLYYEGILEDVTERRRVEAALRDSELRFKRLLDSTTDYIYTVTVAHGRVVKTVHGPGCQAVTGYTSAEYATEPYLWYRMIHEEDRPLVIDQAGKAMAGETVSPIEHRLFHKDGSVRWVKNTLVPRRDEAGQVVAYDGLVSDVTERVSLESQLRQSQKIESVGQLAAGVAHDFNNILSVVQGYSALLLADEAMPPHAQEPLKQIAAASERAAGLTRQLLTFSRKQVMQPRKLDLPSVIDNMAKMLRRTIGADISLQLDFPAALPRIRADVGMIEQVVLNLIVNARDAMPRGGRLTLQVEEEVIERAYIERNPEARPGQFVCLSLTDTGSGIPPEVLPHIFEPFFSTKEVGKGTGLGLATVYGIVKQHEGWIEVATQTGKGTTFRVFLPAMAGDAEEETAFFARPRVRGGQEKILLVEDESSLRNLALQVLKRQGYEVFEAPSGAEALNLWSRIEGEVDLLLTDMVMPDGVSGRELAQRLKASKGSLKVIFTSGYSPEIIGHEEELQEDGTAFLQKPYDPDTLARMVRDCLDGEAQK
jgi:PAS domain S-box-containing protein